MRGVSPSAPTAAPRPMRWSGYTAHDDVTEAIVGKGPDVLLTRTGRDGEERGTCVDPPGAVAQADGTGQHGDAAVNGDAALTLRGSHWGRRRVTTGVSSDRC